MLTRVFSVLLGHEKRGGDSRADRTNGQCEPGVRQLYDTRGLVQSRQSFALKFLPKALSRDASMMANHNITICLATPEDASAIASVMSRSFLKYEHLYNKKAFEATTPSPAGDLTPLTRSRARAIDSGLDQ